MFVDERSQTINHSLRPRCTEKLPRTQEMWSRTVHRLCHALQLKRLHDFSAPALFSYCKEEFQGFRIQVRKIISVRKKKREIFIRRFRTQLESSYCALYSPSLSVTLDRSLQQAVNIKQLRHPFSLPHQPGLNDPAYWTAISRSGQCLSLSFFFQTDPKRRVDFYNHINTRQYRRIGSF